MPHVSSTARTHARTHAAAREKCWTSEKEASSWSVNDMEDKKFSDCLEEKRAEGAKNMRLYLMEMSAGDVVGAVAEILQVGEWAALANLNPFAKSADQVRVVLLRDPHSAHVRHKVHNFAIRRVRAFFSTFLNSYK